jgi:hypothetical protein
MENLNREVWSLRWAPTLISIASASLIGTGLYESWHNQTTTAATDISFGFLTLLLLLLSKFKKFKGFGFEAEMWEQELAKAEQIISQLETLRSSVIEQLAAMSGEAGLWDSGQDLQSRERLLEQLETLSTHAGYDKAKRQQYLKPIYNRLLRDYCWESEHRWKELVLGIAGKDGGDRIVHEAALSQISENETQRKLIFDDPDGYLLWLIGTLKNFDISEPSRKEVIEMIERSRTRVAKIIEKSRQT